MVKFLKNDKIFKIVGSFLILITIITGRCSMLFFRSNKVIEYGTPEFEQFEKNAIIGLEEACKIQEDYRFKLFPNSEKYIPPVLYVCVNDDYVFSSFYVAKRNEVSLFGFYVNSKTGEIVFKGKKETTRMYYLRKQKVLGGGYPKDKYE